MVLELEAGTTPGQCMQKAMGEIAKDAGKSIAEMPMPSWVVTMSRQS